VKTKNKNAIRSFNHGDKSSKGKAFSKHLSFRSDKSAFPASLSASSYSTIISVLIQVTFDVEVMSC
jgi:hypothetical protein